MRFYFSPLSSNSFLPKEKGEWRCKELSEAKVPDLIGIQKKATLGKLRCQSETNEGLHQGGQKMSYGVATNNIVYNATHDFSRGTLKASEQGVATHDFSRVGKTYFVLKWILR